MKVLHVVYQSLPNRKGASIRSDGLLQAQRTLGLRLLVISSPFQKPQRAGRQLERVNGIPYVRTWRGRDEDSPTELGSTWPRKLVKSFQIVPFTCALFRVAQRWRPEVIHSHGHFFVGLSGLLVARALGSEFIYEVRSIWFERPSVRPLAAAVARLFEGMCIRLADHVVTISSGLRREVVRRYGIDSTVVVNSVNMSSFENDNERRSSFTAAFKCGYAGSLSPIEGLDLLVSAWALATPSLPAGSKLQLIGSGLEAGRLRTLIQDLGLSSVAIEGEVPPHVAADVIRSFDCYVLPRRSLKITEFVSPLKQLDALALGKYLICSDVGGVRESVDGAPGVRFIPPDSIEAIAECLVSVSQMDPDTREALGWQNREWVIANRDWLTTARRYLPLYGTSATGDSVVRAAR